MSNSFLYVITVLVWGSTWIAIDFQLGTVAPEVSITYRYLLAAALLFSWCRYRGLNLQFGSRALAYYNSRAIVHLRDGVRYYQNMAN